MSLEKEVLDAIAEIPREEKKYIVLWVNNGRVGSVELTEENLTYLNEHFWLSHIQTDITGTQHWNVLAPLKEQK